MAAISKTAHLVAIPLDNCNAKLGSARKAWYAVHPRAIPSPRACELRVDFDRAWHDRLV